jgi:hypothetical protein
MQHQLQEAMLQIVMTCRRTSKVLLSQQQQQQQQQRQQQEAKLCIAAAALAAAAAVLRSKSLLRLVQACLGFAQSPTKVSALSCQMQRQYWARSWLQ